MHLNKVFNGNISPITVMIYLSKNSGLKGLVGEEGRANYYVIFGQKEGGLDSDYRGKEWGSKVAEKLIT